jgi:hypothetical protein
MHKKERGSAPGWTGAKNQCAPCQLAGGDLGLTRRSGTGGSLRAKSYAALAMRPSRSYVMTSAETTRDQCHLHIRPSEIAGRRRPGSNSPCSGRNGRSRFRLGIKMFVPWRSALPARSPAQWAGRFRTLGVLVRWKIAPIYCQAVLCFDQRVALDGSPAETIDAEAKELATKQLARLAARETAKKSVKAAALAVVELKPDPLPPTVTPDQLRGRVRASLLRRRA